MQVPTVEKQRESREVLTELFLKNQMVLAGIVGPSPAGSSSLAWQKTKCLGREKKTAFQGKCNSS
jgi:hypothetical protein